MNQSYVTSSVFQLDKFWIFEGFEIDGTEDDISRGGLASAHHSMTIPKDRTDSWEYFADHMISIFRLPIWDRID